MSDKAISYVNMAPGDPAPWFHQNSTSNPRYAFDTVGGRYIVLCFLGSASAPGAAAALAVVEANRHLFDDVRASFFGVTIDPEDRLQGRLVENMPGIRHFWDFDHQVSGLYGSTPLEPPADGEGIDVRQFWMVLDPFLRVMAIFGIEQGNALVAYLTKLPPPGLYVGYEVPAPILILPRVFESDFCRHLVEAHLSAGGGEQSGFMREEGGKTIEKRDLGFKSRRDFLVEDDLLVRQIQARITRRVAPEIVKVYGVNCTRMERYLVGCYSVEEGGHFRPHRDNTTKGTAHRRFAISINLNDAFDGGELSFPEFGPRSYKAPIGAALIFPGALLHAVSKVTRGRRYAFLPFVYDEAAAKIQEENARFLEGEAVGYKA